MIYFIQSLEAKFAKMLSTQNEQHQKEMEQLKDEFAKMLAEQQTRMMAQFDYLGQKLRETEQRAQIKKNEVWGCIKLTV
jgi:flagellar biosynthesis/type III secretory pathway chaperone